MSAATVLSAFSPRRDPAVPHGVAPVRDLPEVLPEQRAVVRAAELLVLAPVQHAEVQEREPQAMEAVLHVAVPDA